MRRIRTRTDCRVRLAWLAIVVAFAFARAATAGVCPVSGDCTSAAEPGAVVCSSGTILPSAIPSPGTHGLMAAAGLTDLAAVGPTPDASTIGPRLALTSVSILAVAPKTSPPV